MISNLITSQSFELIRDAIPRVLTLELANQDDLLDADDLPKLNIGIWFERFIPFDKSELPAINIVYSDSEQISENTSFTSVFDNKYLIEVYVNSPSDEINAGDIKSSILLSKIMGLVRSILMNNIYLYLDFTDKFIQTRYVKTITRTQPRIADDAMNTISGAVEIHYNAEENTETQNGIVGTLFSTVVKIEETEKGYKFIKS